MEILSTQQSQRSTSQQPASSDRAVLSSDFETFLKMLSTQLQNQDPLNPVDSADYAVQLATFSSVEQQVLTNNHLEELISQMQVAGMSDLAGWVGMEALTDAGAWYDGTPVTLRPDVPAVADRAVVVVRDQRGQTVLREDIDLTADSFEWDGRTQAGPQAAEGRYSFELESSANGEILVTSAIASYTPVTEARRGLNGTVLVLQGGATVGADSVTGLREGR